MVSPLDRKLLRDLSRQGLQAAVIALVIACAVAVLVGSVATGRALARAQARWYGDGRYADVFAELRRAPEGVAARVAAIPGVAEVETRAIGLARLELPGGDPGTAALAQSLPPGGARLNRPYLRAGSDLAPGREDEVLVSEGLAEANGLAPGVRLVVIVNGRRQVVRVAGVALSPEHVYVVRPGEMFPDDRHYGVVWMPRAALAAALDLEGAFDELSLTLAPGASKPAVIAAVDRVLAPWGGLGAGGRDRQVSHRFLTDEIAELRAMATVVPALLLGVAAFLVSVVLSRLVATQRPQIGMLKALGYRDREIALHYAKWVAAIALSGSALGGVGGVAMGWELGRVYRAFFRLPALAFEGEGWTVALAGSVALVAALAGALAAVRRAAALAPAEAMRPAPPPTFRPTLLERLGLARLLPPAGRMVLRDLGRRPARAVFSALGLALAVAILVVAWFARDAIGLMIDLQLVRAQRQDATVTFTQALSEDAVAELRGIPGVRAVEPFRAIPAVLRRGHRSYRTAVTGVEPGADLERLVGAGGAVVPVPPRGLVLSAQLAGILGVRPGDDLTVEALEGRRASRTLRVAAVVDDLLGVSATASRDALADALGERGLVSGARLAVDAAALPAVQARLLGSPRVAAVTLRAATRASVERLVGDTLLGYMGVIAAVAVGLAAGVVYSAARVTWAERERELATLRVIGFTRGEVWRVLAGEIGVHAALGLPVGCVVGYLFVAATAAATRTDLYRLPIVVAPATYAVAVLAVGATALAVVLAALRWIGRADLVDVLKSRE